MHPSTEIISLRKENLELRTALATAALIFHEIRDVRDRFDQTDGNINACLYYLGNVFGIASRGIDVTEKVHG